MGLNLRRLVQTAVVAAFLIVTMGLVLQRRPVPSPSVAGTSQLESVTRDRLARLHARLEEIETLTPEENAFALACSHDCENAQARFGAQADSARARRQELENELVARMHGVVDTFVGSTMNPQRIDRKAVQESVRRVFPDGSLYGQPIAFVGEAGEGQRLTLVYSLVKSIWSSTSLTVRTYEAIEGRFQYVDSIGDLDGYADISVVELHPPVVGQSYFLLWGKVMTANGPNTGMRIYAYDGRTYRTVWQPENVWGNFTVDVKEYGFTVKGDYYRESRSRDEEYTVTADGVRRTDQ